jgi:valyl-tRNA synthetase
MTAEPRTREEMPKAYNPASVERAVYERWERAWLLHRPNRAGAKALHHHHAAADLTGELHLGHAMMDTVEDILTRWHRTEG